MLSERGAQREEAQLAPRKAAGDGQVVAFLWVPARRLIEPIEMQKCTDAEHGQRQSRQCSTPQLAALDLQRTHLYRHLSTAYHRPTHALPLQVSPDLLHSAPV